MPKLNENYLQLKDSYLFSEIAHRTAAYSEKHPDKPVIRLGIGDVTRPLCECAIKALHESVDEMGQSATSKDTVRNKDMQNKRCHRSLL